MDTVILIAKDWFTDLSKVAGLMLFLVVMGWVWVRIMTAFDYSLHRDEATKYAYEGSKGCSGIAVPIIVVVAIFSVLWAIGEAIDFIM